MPAKILFGTAYRLSHHRLSRALRRERMVFGMRKHCLAGALAGLLILGCSGRNTLSQESKSSPCSQARLAFLLTRNPFADSLLKIFADHLLPGDYLLVGGPDSQAQWAISKANEAQSRIKTGVRVLSWAGYVAIDELEARVPRLPQSLDWVVYDYEGGPEFSPEFTRDQQASLGFFERGQQVSRRHGFQFMVTPPYGQLRGANWDWGRVARFMEAITLQFQAFLQDEQLLETEVRNVVGQIREASPQTLTFIQLSIVPERGTVEDNLRAIRRLEDETQISAFLIFYRPDQSDLLRDFFRQLSRCQ
ncbi:MAG: hypothetical protein ONB48_11380 [candidate division KSB1 bacterium]|nr:hypothetical protein [candidate division KSB1 bacterium]MDZ7286244.1 hypothetical protein [candidate division KSB1 bacterium]MDZ7296470.1 hypothetical protein [candidate division KSB1 bacterium]MDZ7305571.1 hypothetical protein [candidate division KSB1 bacterium]MDZ7347337.1 hypothetical protein [candidate division KSB1 bacterium]